MQFRVDGVDASTGKKVKTLDIAAPDLREAATMAKIRGVFPTRITPVTELLTIVKEPEPGTDEPQAKRTTLISIEGRPLWFAATLVVAVILVVLWFAGPAIRSADQQSNDPQISTGTARGLGWSLRDVEAQWSPNNGWYWSQKERAVAGTGIEYTGSNVAYLHIAIGASIAPLLLVRTDESCIRGAGFARKIHKPIDLLLDSLDEMAGLRKKALYASMFLSFLCLPSMIFCFARTAACVVTLVRHPLVSLAAIPDNWKYASVVLDSTKWPDILPKPRKVPESFDAAICYDVGYLIKDLPHAPKKKLEWLLIIVAATLIIVPAFAYRWSLKSTAIIWFPLLWAMHSVRGAGKPLRTYLDIYLRDPITKIVLWVSIAAIIGFAAKIVLFNEWASFTVWWNATPLRQVLSLYVAPAEIQWWQVAMVINSAIAIVMYILARRWLIRIEHDELIGESLPRRLFQVGLFIRPILSCYTIACTLYITIRAASDWELPALGTKPFPWM